MPSLLLQLVPDPGEWAEVPSLDPRKGAQLNGDMGGAHSLTSSLVWDSAASSVRT